MPPRGSPRTAQTSSVIITMGTSLRAILVEIVGQAVFHVTGRIHIEQHQIGSAQGNLRTRLAEVIRRTHPIAFISSASVINSTLKASSSTTRIVPLMCIDGPPSTDSNTRQGGNYTIF